MYDFLLVSHCITIALFYTILSYLTLNIIVTLKCGLEVTQGHSNWYHLKAWYGFLFAFHSNYAYNYGRIFAVCEISSIKE